jgi:tetratricopeptide (TPR) repeat protein
LWVNQQQYANALADFNQAIQLHPESFIAYTNRGNVFMLQNQPHQALNDFNQAIAINDLYAEAWFNRGTLQMNSVPQNAIADFEQAVQINPGYFDAYNNLGSVYYQMQNYAQAEFYFQQAANIQPQNPSIWLNLAIVQNLLGNYNSAYQRALNSQQLGGNVPATFLEQIKNATR